MLSSLCVIYPGGRSVRIKTKKVFFVFLLSVEALLEADPNEFWFRAFSFFLLVFFSLYNLPWGKVSPHKHTKRFFLVFLLSVEALLEAEPEEFSFGTFYVFFLFVFFLSVEVLLETDPEFDFGNFPYYSYFFFSLWNTHRRKSVRIKTQNRFFLVLLLSVDSLLVADPIEFRFGTFCVFSLSLFSLCVRFSAIFVDVWSSWSEEHICLYYALYINRFSLIYRAVDL